MYSYRKIVGEITWKTVTNISIIVHVNIIPVIRYCQRKSSTVYFVIAR